MGQKVDNGQNEDKTWMTYIGMQHRTLDYFSPVPPQMVGQQEVQEGTDLAPKNHNEQRQ